MARHYKKGRLSHKNLTWRDRYNIYRRDYKRQAKKMKNAGLKMNKKPLEYDKYIQAWGDMKNQLKKEIEKGERKSIGNVNQFLVRQQAYNFSMKVGGAVIPYLIEAGDIEEEPTTLKEKMRLIMKIRQGEFLETQGFWNAVRERRKELYKEYGKYGKKEANEQIAREFFGSK